MGKSTINFPHIFFPIWSMGLFLVMGEYPIIDELGLGSFLTLSFGNWLKANSNRAFSELKMLHVLVTGSMLVGEVKSFTVRKAIK